MGNTVGSTSTNLCNFFLDPQDAYILGLWCADSYWWSSSIGLSNVDKDLIDKFRQFFEKKNFPKGRIKFNRNHLFVNSRPLLREFIAAEKIIRKMKDLKTIKAYFAGRFDGDGSIDKDLRKDCRIVYGGKEEAELDRALLQKIGIDNAKIYYYRTSNTFCLYISRYASKKFVQMILPYSIKVAKISTRTP